MEEHYLVLNLVLEKGTSRDCEWSGSSITHLKMGTPTGFVQRSRLDFWFRNISIYRTNVFSFSFIIVPLTSSQCASLTFTLSVHLSIATAIYSSHLSIILSLFSSQLI